MTLLHVLAGIGAVTVIWLTIGTVVWIVDSIDKRSLAPVLMILIWPVVFLD